MLGNGCSTPCRPDAEAIGALAGTRVGATIAAVGSTLLRSPGINSPRQYLLRWNFGNGGRFRIVSVALAGDEKPINRDSPTGKRFGFPAYSFGWLKLLDPHIGGFAFVIPDAASEPVVVANGPNHLPVLFRGKERPLF